MNLPSYSVRRLRKLAGFAAGGLTISIEEGKEMLGLLSPRKGSEKSKAFKRARSARKAAKSARNEVQSGTLRAMVAARAQYLCELAPKIPHEGREPHHLLSGSAKKIDEKPENVMWVCRYHHDDYHRHRYGYIGAVKDWAALNGLPVPARILRLEQRLVSRLAPQAPESLPERIAK